MQNNNVTKVINSSLCSGCGACAGVCPAGAIKMEWNASGFLKASVDNTICMKCRKCLAVCSGNSENASKLLKDNALIGDYTAGYAAYAFSKKIRKESQSGGAVTALLLFMLEQGMIDGAVVSSYCARLQRPVAEYADSSSGIKRATGSYYSQTAVLQKLWEHKDKRCAVVALGCQAQGIRLASEQGILKEPEMIIGLVCEGEYSIRLTGELMKLAGVHKAAGFRSRSKRYGGWPGGTVIWDTAGREIKLPFEKRWNLNQYYGNYRCLQCFDMNNIFADIVCGDPWHLYKGQADGSLKEGETIIAARTERGQKALLQAQKAGYLVLKEIRASDFLEYNLFETGHLKRTVSAEVFCKSIGGGIPIYTAMQIFKTGFLKHGKSQAMTG